MEIELDGSMFLKLEINVIFLGDILGIAFTALEK